MSALRILPVVLLLSAAVSSGGCGTSDPGFKLIHVDDLVAMLGSNEGAVTLLDANGSDFRTKEGVIPGATLLSSYNSYDVEKELRAGKDARLGFDCADSH